MKKYILSFVAMFFCAVLGAQKITTAGDFFKTISDYYTTIHDYEVDADISIGKQKMQGKVSFKRPEMLRIDFTDPAEQVLLFNGDMLTIYLPGSQAILEQSVDKNGATAATVQGLNLMRRYYTIAYESGQDSVPLDEGSDEMVVNLMLYSRSTSEAFSTIRLSISPDEKLIRRVVATTAQNETYTFDFYNYNLNTNMTDQRFIYDPPSSANTYNNFLFAE